MAPVGERAQAFLEDACATAFDLGREPAHNPTFLGEPKSEERGTTCSPRLIPGLERSPQRWRSRAPRLSPPSLVALLLRREPDPGSQALCN